MTRRGYRFGVQWIAENDEPGSIDVAEISGYISTLLLADLFCKDPIKVAQDIARWRIRNG